MSMSRAQLAANLWGLLQRQFQEVGISNEDSTGNLKEPVDSTLLALEVDYSDLPTAEVANADVIKAVTLSRYYGLRAIYDAALYRVDYQMSVGAPSASKQENRSQYVRQLEESLKRAKAEADPYLPETGAAAFGFGVIALDHIEPYGVEDAS
jgi:hypothetical protein